MNKLLILPIISRSDNPTVMVVLGDSNIELSVIEARQFALGILQATETVDVLKSLQEELDVMVGKQEANHMLEAITKGMKSE